MTIQELLRLRKTTPKHIRVHYDNGDSIETKINATVPEIVRYYLDKKQSFSYGDGPETMATARCVEFVGGIMFYPHGFKSCHELTRVYSISDKFMKRHDLYNKFRCTVKVWDSWGPWYRKEDYAYIGQTFE